MILRIVLFCLIGGLLGFAYYTFWGCDTGCTIKSSPYLMSLYGGLIGLTLSLPGKSEKKKKM